MKFLIALVSGDNIEETFKEDRRESNVPGLAFRVMKDGWVYAEIDTIVCPLLVKALEDGTQLKRALTVAWMIETLEDPEFPWSEGAEAFGADFGLVAGMKPDFGEDPLRTERSEGKRSGDEVKQPLNT